jgi:hypothetical protein
VDDELFDDEQESYFQRILNIRNANLHIARSLDKQMAGRVAIPVTKVWHLHSFHAHRE